MIKYNKLWEWKLQFICNEINLLEKKKKEKKRNIEYI